MIYEEKGKPTNFGQFNFKKGYDVACIKVSFTKQYKNLTLENS